MSRYVIVEIAQIGGDKARCGQYLQQQARFDTFIDQYSPDQPHQALDERAGRRQHAVCGGPMAATFRAQ